jgi:predicted secreted protein
MKTKLILAVTVAILALSLLACGTAVTEVPLQATYDDFVPQKYLTRNVNANIGDTIKVTLFSNPSTGFSWQLAGISDLKIITQEGKSIYIAPTGTAIGAGGQEYWTFKALKKGAGRISLAYSRPWEGGTKGEWTLDINVSIK